MNVPLVCDYGSGFSKVGFSGTEAPRAVFPTILGKLRHDVSGFDLGGVPGAARGLCLSPYLSEAPCSPPGGSPGAGLLACMAIRYLRNSDFCVQMFRISHSFRKLMQTNPSHLQAGFRARPPGLPRGGTWDMGLVPTHVAFAG